MSRKKSSLPSPSVTTRRILGGGQRVSYKKGSGQSSKQATGHSTQLGPAAVPRGEYGAYDKTLAGPEQLVVATTPTLTITGLTPDITEMEVLDVPYGISETLTAFAPDLLEQDDLGLDVPLATITIVGLVPELVEFDGNDEQLLVSSVGNITITGFAPDLVEGEDLDVATTPTLLLLADPPTLDEQGLLPPILSYSDASVVWDLLRVEVNGISMTMRQAIARLLGDVSGLPQAIARIGTGQGTVSAGGRGLYFEPQTIDKALKKVDEAIDELRKASKRNERGTKVVERVVEKQPIYITAPGSTITKLVQPVVVSAQDDEEEAVVQAIMALMED